MNPFVSLLVIVSPTTIYPFIMESFFVSITFFIFVFAGNSSFVSDICFPSKSIFINNGDIPFSSFSSFVSFTVIMYPSILLFSSYE